MCLDTASCQSHILNVDAKSTVDIYSLSTVGTTWQLSIDQHGVVNEVKNPNGFAATMTCWTR
jgi:glucan 1,3-beta-glucosidase